MLKSIRVISSDKENTIQNKKFKLDQNQEEEVMILDSRKNILHNLKQFIQNDVYLLTFTGPLASGKKFLITEAIRSSQKDGMKIDYIEWDPLGAVLPDRPSQPDYRDCYETDWNKLLKKYWYKESKSNKKSEETGGQSNKLVITIPEPSASKIFHSKLKTTEHFNYRLLEKLISLNGQIKVIIPSHLYNFRQRIKAEKIRSRFGINLIYLSPLTPQEITKILEKEKLGVDDNGKVKEKTELTVRQFLAQGMSINHIRTQLLHPNFVIALIHKEETLEYRLKERKPIEKVMIRELCHLISEAKTESLPVFKLTRLMMKKDRSPHIRDLLNILQILVEDGIIENCDHFRVQEVNGLNPRLLGLDPFTPIRLKWSPRVYLEILGEHDDTEEDGSSSKAVKKELE